MALFESGDRDVGAAFGNVSATDVMSLGFLQWNHNAGSLYGTLLRGLGTEAVLSAPASIRAGVSVLIDVANERGTRNEALTVLKGWQANGSVKSEARRDLQTWLKSPPLMARQNELIDARLSSALMTADAWARDWALAGPSAAQRAFYSFTGVEVFNGSLAGLWVEHVREFRRHFSNALAMMDHISAWVADCRDFKLEGIVGAGPDTYQPRYRELYRRNETVLAVAEWRRMTAVNDTRIDEDALNLLALGYLRARMSNGNDRPSGFHGVFQLDVLNRRGMMATGVGVLNGTTDLVELYRL